MPKASYVVPIQVGAARTTQKLPMLRDDSGENISEQNPNFSELTALYWLWKNADRNGIEAWGLCHYRRYFSMDVRKLLFIKKSRIYYELTQSAIDAVVNNILYEKMQSLLQTHDVILQRPTYAHKKGGKTYTIEEAYAHAHHAVDWEITTAIIRRKYPAFSTSIDAFNKQVKMSYYNMMVARWTVWEGYLSWLFDILLEAQKEIHISTDPYQARIFGFLSERMLNLYVYHHRLRPAYLTIALFEK
ncbi:MAG: hypothetical protein JWP88_2283 [Flaviaesturariibacter sp.]|nr:hypothetical protein [Flaviaesturariibacter sp.]